MKILVAGDVCPTASTEKFLVNGDLSAAFGDVRSVSTGADAFLINLECALTAAETAIRKYGPNLKAAPECAQALHGFGVTDAGLANNHIYDYGRKGYFDTLRALEEAGIRYTGVGMNAQCARKKHTIALDGKSICLIAVGDREYSYALANREGIRVFDPIDTIEDVRDARNDSDFIIVTYHGGSEQCRYPSPRVRKLCQAMVRAGADLVLCQHSHCIGVMEKYEGKMILYGQGNFYFNLAEEEDNPHWKNGLLLEIDMDSNMTPAYRFYPVKTTDTGIALCHGEEEKRILQELEERSLVLQDEGEWIKRWRAFCLQESWRYHDAISTAFESSPYQPSEWFRHYLDCEAHTDVWRQLYPTWNANDTLEEREFE